MNICVYSSSSDAVGPEYFAAARELGTGIAARGHGLVYGGSDVGLMGAVAFATKAGGGKVFGVMPKALAAHGVAYDDADELVFTDTMRERKEKMEQKADAFVALPGGFGTFEELLEIITLKQLEFHNKPVVLFNVAGFFTPLLELFEGLYRGKFAKPEARGLYSAVSSTPEIFAYFDSYRPIEIETKWTRHG